jgi:lysozyme
MSLIESVKESEGFRDKVYKCTEGFDTIGYGFAVKDLVLEEDICEMILERKLEKLIESTDKKFPFLRGLPLDKSEVVYEMVYQMGLSGVSKFKKMLAALEKKDYEKSATEMLDSRWAKQTPNRALKLSNIMKGSK